MEQTLRAELEAIDRALSQLATNTLFAADEVERLAAGLRARRERVLEALVRMAEQGNPPGPNPGGMPPGTPSLGTVTPAPTIPLPDQSTQEDKEDKSGPLDVRLISPVPLPVVLTGGFPVSQSQSQGASNPDRLPPGGGQGANSAASAQFSAAQANAVSMAQLIATGGMGGVPGLAGFPGTAGAPGRAGEPGTATAGAGLGVGGQGGVRGQAGTPGTATAGAPGTPGRAGAGGAASATAQGGVGVPGMPGSPGAGGTLQVPEIVLERPLFQQGTREYPGSGGPIGRPGFPGVGGSGGMGGPAGLPGFPGGAQQFMARLAIAQASAGRAGMMAAPGATGRSAPVGAGQPGQRGGVRIEGPSPLLVRVEGGSQRSGAAGGASPGVGIGAGAGGSPAAEMAARLATTQKVTEFEEKRLKVLSSSEGRKAIQQEVHARKQLAVVQAQSRFATMAAEQGFMSASMSRFAEQTMFARQAVSQMSSTMHSFYASGSQAVLSLASMAGPFSAFPTFEASVQSVGIALGQALLPGLNEVSAALQQAARWIRSLDEGTKTSIGKWVVYGTVAAGAAAVLLKVASAAMAAGRAIFLLGAAITSNPITAGIGLITVALGGLALAWYSVRDAAGSANAAMGKAGQTSFGRPGAARREVEPLLRKDLEQQTRDKEDLVPKQHRTALLESFGDPKKMQEAVAAYQKAMKEQFSTLQKTDFMAGAQFIHVDEAIRRAIDMTRKEYRRGREAADSGKPLGADSTSLERSIASMDQGRGRQLAAEILAARIGNIMIANKVPEVVQGEVRRRLVRGPFTRVRQWDDPSEMVKDPKTGQERPRRHFSSESMPDFFGDVFGLKTPRKYELMAETQDDKRQQSLDLALARMRTAEMIAAKAAVTLDMPGTKGPAPGSPEAMARSLRGLPESRISDLSSFVDRITVAGLKPEGNLDAQNRAQQLAELQNLGLIMKGVKTAAEESRDATREILRASPWRY